MDSTRRTAIDQLVLAAEASNVVELRQATEVLRATVDIQLSVWSEDTGSLPLVRRFALAWLEAANRDCYGRIVWRDVACELANALYSSAQLREDLCRRVEALIETVPGQSRAAWRKWWQRAVDRQSLF